MANNIDKKTIGEHLVDWIVAGAKGIAIGGLAAVVYKVFGIGAFDAVTFGVYASSTYLFNGISSTVKSIIEGTKLTKRSQQAVEDAQKEENKQRDRSLELEDEVRDLREELRVEREKNTQLTERCEKYERWIATDDSMFRDIEAAATQALAMSEAARRSSTTIAGSAAEAFLLAEDCEVTKAKTIAKDARVRS